MSHILIVDDEEGIRSFLQEALEWDEYDVLTAANGIEALGQLDAHDVSLMLTDLKMPQMDGIELMQQCRQKYPDVVVVMLTAHGSIDVAVQAMKIGAFDFLQKPLGSPKELREMVSRALKSREETPSEDAEAPSGTSHKNRTSGAPAPDALPLTHGAPAMAPVVEALQKVAPTDATVLLTGESGTGKEVAARKLHAWSDRSEGPFVAINCAALAEQLIESELFGHEKGAFTGAESRRIGSIEQADGGTFFLDEIGELRLEIQAKLLRVLQEKAFVRIGGSETIRCDVRWIAATNRDLLAQVQEGNFREDLYHRLAVFPIHLPPLRERVDDIVPIARLLLTRIGQRLGKDELQLSEALEKELPRRSWPGNVRELSNALERAAILSSTEVIEAEHLQLPQAGPPLTPSPGTGHAVPLAEAERDAIAQALSEVDGNRRKAAEILGIAERTLYDKIKKYNL